MTRDLQMRMQELRYTTTIKERLEGELQAARSIQMSLLPKTFPAFPERTDFDIHAIVRPAREVGGDFYDFYFIDEDRICALIGDVSGKGIPAALFMAVTKTLCKANASPTCSPAGTLARVNRELCTKAKPECSSRFSTCFSTYEPASFNSATPAIIHALLISVRGEVTALSGQAGMALGLLAGH
jgi:sigma-B regulation protein RsbU (phosphoserine phosphatase)